MKIFIMCVSMVLSPVAMAVQGAASPTDEISSVKEIEKTGASVDNYPGRSLGHVPRAVNEFPLLPSNGAKYYEAAPDGELNLKRMDISAGTFILIYAGSGSSVAVRGLEEIRSDGVLGPAFTAWASLLTDNYDFKKAAAWNSAHRVKYKIMHSRTDWPGLRTDSVPGFNFFRDGRLVCYAGGWSDNASVPELKKCMETSGLLSVEARLAAALRIIGLRVADRNGYAERITLFQNEYRKLSSEGAFGKSELKTYGHNTLLDAYRASELFVFYSPVKEKLGLMENIFAEFESREMVDARKARALYAQFLDAREFERAELLRTRYGSLMLEPFPRLTGAKPAPGKVWVYKLDDKGKRLKADALVSKDRQIVIAGQPGCSPTRNAFDAIEKDKKLRGIFKENGLLLAAGSDFQGVLDWNDSHVIKFEFINSAGDWPGMDFDTYPSFYFVKGGKIAHKFTSWPKDGNMAEIRKGLGLLGYY